MAETTDRPAVVPAPPPAADTDSLDYRPVSGWAVASAVIAGIYVVVIVVGGGIALYTWSPYLLPLWTVLLPVVGLILALAGQSHVRRTEGTRAGAGLARLSLWTCLLLGVIYLSFYVSTFLAVRKQSDNFVREWFGVLKAGKVNEAFLLTLRSEQRQNVSAEDELTLRARFDVGPMGGRGVLNDFRGSELAQFIQQGGPDSRIEGRGVQAWDFTEGVYRVTRLYQVVTPEGDIDVTITAHGAESKARPGAGRQWYLNFDRAAVTRARLTPFGKITSTLRYEGNKFLDEWRKKLLVGTAESLESAYLDTQPVAEREARRAALRAGKVELKGFVTAEHVRADDPPTRKAVLDAIAGLFRPPAEGDLRLMLASVSHEGTRRWEKTADGRVQFTYDGNLVLGSGRMPKYRSEFAVVVESDPGALETGVTANWRVLRVEVLTALDPTRPSNMMRID